MMLSCENSTRTTPLARRSAGKFGVTCPDGSTLAWEGVSASAEALGDRSAPVVNSLVRSLAFNPVGRPVSAKVAAAWQGAAVRRTS